MRLALSTLQWAMFILAGSVVAPLAIGQAYGMSPLEIGEFVQRTLFVLGIVALVQTWWGHRLPIMEGPAALWWGVFLLFGSLGAATGEESRSILPALGLGLVFSGVLFVIMSMCGWIAVIRRLFTPAVIGTYFILLVMQMSGPFVNGILGTASTSFDWKATSIAIATLILSFILARSSLPFLRNYSVLISILFGWSLFQIFGLQEPFGEASQSWFTLPGVFSFGWPEWDGGIILTSVIVTLLLLSNMIASMEAVGHVLENKDKVNEKRTGLIMGGSQLLSASFATVSFVPLSYTAGFIMTTRMKEKLPFLLGNGLLVLISFFPAVTGLFASIPVSVGYASIFLSFVNMLGMGLQEIARDGLGERQLYIVGISIMIGTGCMFIPSSFLFLVPPFLSPLISNGLLMGVASCLLLERLVRKEETA
ncbi:xanthine permease [Brevibacillus panacihumi W25]|uniref:Xanthine permease n=1 Tax=Brevibacillus panacihumi W25 TaxID=1408254 RepID=V6LYB7_9BACL|nr:purine/pyrimidine permease [Brevibacillus panacihumi]EST51521.1 xanthine permease [Brevibacillus panacihumi W25]